MKNRAFVLILLALICCYCCLREYCRAWITVEAMKVGAPIFKKPIKQ